MWQAPRFLTDVDDNASQPRLLPSLAEAYEVMWKREAADQILYGSPAFFLGI